MSIQLQVVQQLSKPFSTWQPREADFLRWIAAPSLTTIWKQELAFRGHERFEVVMCLVESEESQRLNRSYRGQDKPTNVLSFPAEQLPISLSYYMLGDVALCVDVIEKEACEQKKSLEAHYAHLSVHAWLHLLGWDHIEIKAAEAMERMEIKVLSELGYPNPYVQTERKNLI